MLLARQQFSWAIPTTIPRLREIRYQIPLYYIPWWPQNKWWNESNFANANTSHRCAASFVNRFYHHGLGLVLFGLQDAGLVVFGKLALQRFQPWPQCRFHWGGGAKGFRGHRASLRMGRCSKQQAGLIGVCSIGSHRTQQAKKGWKYFCFLVGHGSHSNIYYSNHVNATATPNSSECLTVYSIPRWDVHNKYWSN